MEAELKVSENADGGRLHELDVLRGFAALAVVLFHYLTRYDELYKPRDDVPFGFTCGSNGVELFFVISGFVIFMTLCRCKTGSDFIVSRFSRLYPAYWTAALLTYSVGSFWPLPGQHYSLMQLFSNATMLQGFLHVESIDGVYWTLAVELCFYAVMLSLFLLGLLANTVRLSIIWLLAAAGAYFLSRLEIDVSWTIQQVLVLKYIEFFVAGINFYELYRKREVWTRITLIGFCLLVHVINHGLRSGLSALIIFGLVGIAVSGRARCLCIRPLVWLGTISYSLYLTHQMIGFGIIRYLAEHGVSSMLAIPTTVAFVLLMACVITYSVERPAMRAIRAMYKMYKITDSSRPYFLHRFGWAKD